MRTISASGKAVSVDSKANQSFLRLSRTKTNLAARPSFSFTRVLANILASILQRLLVAGLGELVAPGGVLVLSGILEEQVADMEAAVQAQGLQILSRKQIEDWVALAVQPRKP